MAEISGFHNSVNGDRRVKADFFARFFGSFIGNGVFPNPSTGCQVIANNDMTVTVKVGKAWINGVFYENTADLVLSLDVADGVLKRIDRVVLQYSTIDRTIVAKVKKGTFASSPVAPVLQRDGDVWELGIADVYIGAGTTGVSQSNITDLRLSDDYCGLVIGLIDQIDGETLFIQYQSWITEKQNQFNVSLISYIAEKQIEIDQTQDNFEQDFFSWLVGKKSEFDTWMNGEESEFSNWKDGEKTDFDIWFETIQGILNSDMAGNLLSLFNDHKSDLSNPHEVTKLQIGLGNADNTADIDKPISMLQQEQFDSISINTLLFDEKIKNTIQELNFSADGNISEIKHMRGETVVRQDVFTISDLLIQETRTLNTGESLTIKNHLQNGFVNEVEVI